MSLTNKVLALFDGQNVDDSASINNWYDTDIQFRNPDTGEVVFRTKNKIILAGSGLIARKLFDISGTEVTPSYNTKMVIPTPTPTITPQPEVNPHTAATQTDPRVLLFCVGTDGCGVENSQVYPVDYKKWMSPNSMIPLRYPLKTNDLSDVLRETYFGRVAVGADRIGYYFKRFDTAPILVQQFVDGTPIDANIYDSTKVTEAESYIELNLKITKEDTRDFFIATTGIADAKINSLSLCSAWPKAVDGKIYFQDIRPITKLNIPNEPLIDLSKGIDVIYHIYL